ncbi:MAG: cysteine desulfurase [Bdellovibrionaceae bacterium]|nr:cysteine desulfurase [Pseudobdellovibrionaceae bacterium]
MNEQQKPIYLDYNATTPLDPEVFAAMEPYFKIHFGNPASANHPWGWAAQKGVEKARTQISTLIAANPLEITFTSGATESNNWVIFSLIEKIRREEGPNAPLHFVTSAIEHSSVMKAMKEAERRGVEVDFIKTNKHGQVEVESVQRCLKPHTRLLSFIWVQNEVGSINPIQELTALAKERQIYLHTDATQAVGKIPVNLETTPVDFLSASAHKFYGPKGAGILYIRSKNPKISLPPYFFGGGQEYGKRSGTLNVPAIVGLGAAAELCKNKLPEERVRTAFLRDYLWAEIKKALPNARLNGHPTERSPINLSITLPGTNIDLFLPKLGELAFSQGSACHTGSMDASPVLQSLGLTDSEAQGTLRLSLGRWTTQEDLNRATAILAKAFN